MMISTCFVSEGLSGAHCCEGEIGFFLFDKVPRRFLSKSLTSPISVCRGLNRFFVGNWVPIGF